jgi:hypothetical protein
VLHIRAEELPCVETLISLVAVPVYVWDISVQLKAPS